MDSTDGACGPLSVLSREFVLACDPEGRVVAMDERAERLFPRAIGGAFAAIVPPGAEGQARALLERGRDAVLIDWDLSVVIDRQVVTVSFSGGPDGSKPGHVTLLGTRPLEAGSRASPRATEAMNDIVNLNREVTRQKQEIEQHHVEARVLNAALAESNQGVMALHGELEDRADSLRRNAEVKSRLVTHVSHELRTPLHSILGLSKLLLERSDGPLNEEQEKQIRFIRTCAEELAALVNDVLDLSKIEAGRLTLRAEPFDLSEFLTAMRGSLKPLLPPDAQVALVVDPLPRPITMDTDRAKLSQVVRNLVSNAIKFTEHGEIHVGAREEADGAVRLYVSDTGIGIAPEHHDLVFEEFGQVDGPLQDKVKGTGLGLPLARRLTQLLGGEIELDSDVGRGARFTLRIPRVPLEVREMHDLETRSHVLDPTRAPILVLEDDRKTIFIYEKYLAAAGFQVIPARSTDDAWRALKRVRPSAIVLDVMLEGESTWNFLAQLKQDPETKDIPVLVVTITNKEHKARALGADEFWLKPIDQDQLLRRLRSLTGTRPAKVLVIDDDERARYLIRKLLTGTPFTLLEAADGREGLRIAQQERPNVIFLDFCLTSGTAFDVLDDLRANPATQAIPVIISTSHALDAVEKERLFRDATAIINKDNLSRELAINRIRDALRRGKRESDVS